MIRISGTKVAELLGRKSKSQGWLATQAGVDKNTVSAIVQAGDAGSLRQPKTVSRVAKTLGVPFNDLLVEDAATEVNEVSVLNHASKCLQDASRVDGTHEAVPSRDPVVFLGHLPETGRELVGRKHELELLEQAWPHDHKPPRALARVVVLVAGPGVGKTSVVNEWLRRMQRDQWREAEIVFAWSFDNQGADSEQQTSADLFLDAALRQFEPSVDFLGTSMQRAERLAKLIRKRRALLILDGLEPLQQQREEEGRVRDKAMNYLLRELAISSSGLCVITTRVTVTDLRDMEPAAVRQVDMENLNPDDGAELLRRAGVKGSDVECRRAAIDFGGHCLALTLLASYLTDRSELVTNRDQIGPLINDARRGGQARRVMASCERWLNERELAVLYLLGLFDRPAEPAAVEALLAAPAISALAQPLATLSRQGWRQVINRLRRLRLLHEPSPHDPTALDTHPLIREYFREQLRSKFFDSWIQGNRRLFQYFTGIAEPLPATITAMEPLFRATVYGCNASMHRQSFNEVFLRRIMRGHESYATESLHALGSVVHVISHFFETKEFDKPVPRLSVPDQRRLLMETARCLTAAKGYASPEAERCYRGALDLTRASSESTTRFFILHGLCLVYRVRGDLSQSLDVAIELQKLATRMKPEANTKIYTLAAQRALATVRFYRGEFQRVKSHAETGQLFLSRRQALRAAKLFINEPAIGCTGYIALAEWFLGNTQNAKTRCATALAQAESLKHGHTHITTLLIQAMISQFSSDRVATKKAADLMGEQCAAHGYRLWELAADLLRAWAAADTGDAGQETLRQMRRNVEAWVAMGASLFMPYWLALRAEVSSRCGRNNDAFQDVTQAVQIARRTGETWWLAELLRMQAELMITLNRSSTEAGVILREARQIATIQGAKSLLSRLK